MPVLVQAALLGGGTLILLRPERSRRNARRLKAHGTSERMPPAVAGGDNLWNEFQSLPEANAHLALSAVTAATAVAGAVALPMLGPVSAVLSLYGTRRLYARAWDALVREHRASVALLNALFIVGALARGYYVLIGINSLLYSVTCNLLLRTRAAASAATFDQLTQFPRTVRLEADDGETREVPLELIRVGALIVVGAGETIPIDGTVVDGAASVDQHVLTGESQPVERMAGDPVLALTLVLSGRIRVRVEQTGSDTVAAGIAMALARTVDHRSQRQLQAETVIAGTVTPGLALSLLALPVGGVDAALAALNAHPRYKISFIAPLGMLRLLKTGLRQGVLVKDGRALDALDAVDTVVLDKTGTLTETEPRLVAIHALEGWHEDQILALAAALEATQTHPIARCIRVEAEARALVPPSLEHLDLAPGLGVAGWIGGERARIGSLRYLAAAGVEIAPGVTAVADRVAAEGQGVVAVAVGQHIVGIITLAARLRPEARQVIAALRAGGIRSLVLISGDHEAPTRQVAEALGMDSFYAETLPAEKARLIRRLQAGGQRVCYVGDGINDAIALREANASVSLSGATSIARDTAQIILLDGTLNGLPHALHLGRRFQTRMGRALAITFVPAGVALGGVFFLHFGIWQTILLDQLGMVGGLVSVHGDGLGADAEPKTSAADTL